VRCDMPIIGWDLGGAHLKAACVDAGRLREVVQLPCPLWRGLDRLDAALAEALARVGPAARHAVTMTGELADLFADRVTGVRTLVQYAAERLPGECRIYAGAEGLVSPSEASLRADSVASANWHATAAFVVGRVADGLLIDIGSTTTDIIPLRNGRLANRGYTDYERLEHGELVYAGVVRTPLSAVADRVPFEGRWRPLAAEAFATTADVYRVLGVLGEQADQDAPADGGRKDPEASAQRLARILGRDREPVALERWRALARYLAGEQMRRLQRAMALIASTGAGAEGPLVGAGAGRFLVAELARIVGRPYVDFAGLWGSASPGLRDRAAICAPAVAVARLACEHRAFG
jgi:(4-(4-[2-(gamma-L-glutamylamino)ethyl]phenoxymethyl)furan-2-yl)methanamine synthase